MTELISETKGLEEGSGRGIKATQHQLCSHNYTHKATNKSHSHNASQKINFFLGSGLGHVGQIVEAGLVDLQAFFSQIKTREETNVSEGQASVRLCLKTAARLNAIFDFSPSVQR